MSPTYMYLKSNKTQLALVIIYSYVSYITWSSIDLRTLKSMSLSLQ